MNTTTAPFLPRRRPRVWLPRPSFRVLHRAVITGALAVYAVGNLQMEWLVSASAHTLVWQDCVLPAWIAAIPPATGIGLLLLTAACLWRQRDALGVGLALAVALALVASEPVLSYSCVVAHHFPMEQRDLDDSGHVTFKTLHYDNSWAPQDYSASVWWIDREPIADAVWNGGVVYAFTPTGRVFALESLENDAGFALLRSDRWHGDPHAYQHYATDDFGP